MSVAERIAQKRKELGLSQEALGEALGVSRQAIYKWESGAALPEIEKLVALSRIFSVSVGWLLGVEESAHTEAAPEADGGELSEAQLRMVEELVRRYQESQPTPRKRRRWPLVLAVIVLVVVFCKLFSSLNRLQNDFSSLRSSVDYIESNVNGQINSITGRVEDMLTRINTFTVAHSAEITSADLAANTVSFALEAMPKTYTEGMTALFRADCGDGQVLEVPAEMDAANGFSAALTCPLTDEICLSVVFVTGDRQETQAVRTYYDLYRSSFPVDYLDTGPLFFDVEENILQARDFFVKLNGSSAAAEPAELPRAEIASLRFGLFRDHKLVCWFERLEEQPESFHGDWGDALFFHNPQPVPLDLDGEYCLALVVTDNYGREQICPDIPVVYDEAGADWTYGDSALADDLSQWEY